MLYTLLVILVISALFAIEDAVSASVDAMNQAAPPDDSDPAYD